MTTFVELVTAYPAVVFTSALLFCMVWFLVTTVLGELGDHGHGHMGHTGHTGHIGHGGHGPHPGGHAGHDLHHGQAHGGHHGPGHHEHASVSTLPPAISLSMISFVGWVISLCVTAGLRAAEVEGPALWVAGAATLVVAGYAGLAATRPLARAMAPLFVTQLAPSEDEVVGSFAKVRSPELDDDDLGEPGRVVIVSGPLKSAAFRAKAVPGRRFPLGATVFVVDAERVDGRLVVFCDDPTPELAP